MLTADEKEKRREHYQANKQAYKEKANKWKAANPEKTKVSRRKGWVRVYGITWDDYEAMYNSQEGRCAICGKFGEMFPKHKKEGLYVDHCHTTGKVRGLLCNHCNVAIGMLQEDPALFLKAAAYVNR